MRLQTARAQPVPVRCDACPQRTWPGRRFDL